MGVEILVAPALVCLFADRRTSGREHNKNGAASWTGNRRTPRGIKKSLVGQLLLFLSHRGRRLPQITQSHGKKAPQGARETHREKSRWAFLRVSKLIHQICAAFAC